MGMAMVAMVAMVAMMGDLIVTRIGTYTATQAAKAVT
jgi:hypothetical protein